MTKIVNENYTSEIANIKYLAGFLGQDNIYIEPVDWDQPVADDSEWM